MDDLISELWRILMWGCRLLAWELRMIAKLQQSIRGRRQVYQRMASAQSEADSYDLTSHRIRGPERVCEIEGKGGANET